MRHQVRSQKFNRTSNERKLLIRSLISSMVVNGKVLTSKTKANLLKRTLEKMLTYARRNERLVTPRLMEWLPNKELVQKLQNEVLPKIEGRKSGLTTLTNMGIRKGDNTKQVLVEWVNKIEEEPKSKIMNKEESSIKKPITKKRNANG